MTIFYINRENLFKNLNTIKKCLKPNTKICAMIKADAYSHSSKKISKLLCDKVDYFGVANIREGVEIRKQRISTPILCVGSFSGQELKLASKYDIDVTIHSIHCLKILKNTSQYLKVHIKIDTGMTRLGIKSKAELVRIVKELKELKNIQIVGIFSHFVDSINKDISEMQLIKFNRFLECFKQEKIIKHISNSNGILNSDYNFDMCRVGLALYGYGHMRGLLPVLEVESEVVDIHTIEKGESVGYDQNFIAKEKTIVATIPFGYADGFDMRYSGAFVFINQNRYKVIGKVCMDMFMCKVDESIKIGDKVIILKNADYLAKYSNKSTYEVLSNFKNKRCKVVIR